METREDLGRRARRRTRAYSGGDQPALSAPQDVNRYAPGCTAKKRPSAASVRLRDGGLRIPRQGLAVAGLGSGWGGIPLGNVLPFGGALSSGPNAEMYLQHHETEARMWLDLAGEPAVRAVVGPHV